MYICSLLRAGHVPDQLQRSALARALVAHAPQPFKYLM